MFHILISGVAESGMDWGWEMEKVLNIWVLTQNVIKDLCTG